MKRREFLKTGGALVVSFAMPAQAAAPAAASWPKKVPAEALDSWIAVAADGSVVASTDKVETGMGIRTAFTQIVADELDVPFDRVDVRMGDTATAVDQRGTGRSDGIMRGGAELRKAAAQARVTLLALAAERLKVPAEKLRVEGGVVSAADDPSKRVSYAELVGGKRLDVTIDPKVKTKEAGQYKLVGQPVPRLDIPPKVRGDYRYVADLRVDGMLHGRVIRPPEAGAKILEVDAAFKAPGLVKVVRIDDFLGVVCEREEQAIEAARMLPVKWSKPQPRFFADADALFASLRAAPPRVTKAEGDAAAVEGALAKAARVVEARYDYPFQSHSSMGPACAVADVNANGAVVWFGGQKGAALRLGLADLLGIPVERIRVQWQPGPGSYGQNDADDCACDCALLSQAAGRPVRLQYARLDGTGWDPKGPPIAFAMKAGLDASGRVTAFDCETRGLSGRTRRSGSDAAGDSLAGQLTGRPVKSIDLFQIIDEEEYEFGAKRKVSHLLDWQRSLGTALRTSHLRDPDGMAKYFALESFVDELALAAKMDPVEFRLKHLHAPRDVGVIRAAAEKAAWQPRVGPNPKRDGTGRGIAYADRHGTLVAIVAEVEVDRDTGKYRVRRFTCAHDCGFVVNPSTLRGTIEANLIQGMSRAKYEAVRFDATRVLSTDWITYPTASMADAPDAIDIVIVGNKPGAKSYGAGEPATRPVAAAIANAIFDATGVRLRRCPLTPQALLGAMKA